jgi:pimeloyl-ACP methyl ester carboxylesterase
MGSQLWRGHDLLWPDVRDILRRPETFALPENDDLLARGVVNEIVVVPNFYKQEQYTRLVHFLSDALGYTEGKDLLVFAYDWRKDLRLAARRLAAEVESFRRALPDPNAKLTMLAHSMGCLVTRYYLDQLGGDAVAGRAVLMGGPQLGIPKFIVAILAGLSVLPFGMMGERLRRVVSTFPSAYQTLPTYACVFDGDGKPIDVYADERWLLEPRGDLLRDGLAFRKELSDRARVPTTCIFGYGMKTISKIVVDVTPEGHWSNPRFLQETIGDGTIPDASAILQGADIHPVQQQHEALYTDNDVKMRLKLELTR